MIDRLQSALADRYMIERELGRGGNAVVYLARDLKHDRKVALKVLLPELALAVRTERFFREIQIAAKLSHPHILTLIDSGQAGDVLYYVMPYVEGESLRDRLTREKQLPLEDALQITRDVAGALGYAHQQGVVHRDIKPENILLHGGHAVVMDFGIARALTAAGGGTITEAGIAVGTPAYMSPEQASGAPTPGVSPGRPEAADGRSDIYSLGCVLYEMLAGHPPFTGATAQEILARHALDPVPSLKAARPGVPEAVERAVGTALAKVPADRFPTVRQFVEALAAGSPQPARSGRRVVFALVAMGLVIAAAALAPWRLATRTTAAERSVAVLPCVNLSTDSTTEYFSDGMTEDLINKLLQIQGLRVPGYASSARFKGQRDLAATGKSLGVVNLLVCTVRRVGSQLRVGVQLVKASDGLGVWGDTYERELRSAAEIYALQEGIALAVAGQLRVTLSGADTAALARAYTSNMQAWELYQRGRREWWKRGAEAMRRAVDYFEQAIHLDSSFALAYSGLADALILAQLPQADRMIKAEAAALKAVALDDRLAEGHVSLARTWHNQGGREDFAAAEREYKRAFALNPRYALAHNWYALLLARDWGRRFDEAVREGRLAVELEPLSAPLYNNLGIVLNQALRPQEAADYLLRAITLEPQYGSPYYLLANAMIALRRPDEAIEYAQEGTRLDPRRTFTHLALGESYASKGRYDDALSEYQIVVNLSEAPAATLAAQGRSGRVHALMGNRSKAREILGQIQAGGTNATTLVAQTVIYLGLGENDRALETLERADSAGSAFGGAGVVFFLGPMSDPIRNDPRFKAILAREGRGAP